MEKHRIYISGQITGLKPDEYEPLFNDAEANLQTKGYDVVNPLRIVARLQAEHPEDLDPARHTKEEIWQTLLKADIAELMSCHAIYMLTNWEFSEGAKLEHHIARCLSIPVVYATEPRHRDIKEAIEAVMGVPFRTIVDDNRTRWNVYARMIYAHHCKKDGDSTQQIAVETRHDESSVGYYLRHYDGEYRFNKEFRKAAEGVVSILDKKRMEQEGADYGK